MLLPNVAELSAARDENDENVVVVQTGGKPGHSAQHGAEVDNQWMGHAQLSTTAIYADAVGAEEKSIAAKMWRCGDVVTGGVVFQCSLLV